MPNVVSPGKYGPLISIFISRAGSTSSVTYDLGFSLQLSPLLYMEALDSQDPIFDHGRISYACNFSKN